MSANDTDAVEKGLRTSPNAQQRESDARTTVPVRSVPDDFFDYEKRVDDSAVRGLFNVGPSKHDACLVLPEAGNAEGLLPVSPMSHSRAECSAKG